MLVCPALVGRSADHSTVPPRRHWKSTTPRSVNGDVPRTSLKLVPSCRVEAPVPTARNGDLALAASTHCLVLELRYCRRKLMYIRSCGCPSPGMDPRMPTQFLWSGGLHTSTVAHSSREVSRACFREVERAAGGRAEAANAGAARAVNAPRTTSRH